MVRTKNEITSDIVKRYGSEAGADIVGIASSASFDSAPDGFRPSDHFEGCLSVIILGVTFPEEALTDDTAEYIDIRNAVNVKVNAAAKDVAKQIKNDGYKAKEIGGMGGKYIDGMTRGPISLKHAAEQAGLGTIGKNCLLTNSEYGNLLWFSAVLTDASLAPDEKVRYNICYDCDICVKACPVGALNDINAFRKKECADHYFKMVDKKWKIKCFLCRKMCPHRFGMKGK
ncbi:MAG: hypothetical protein LBE48_04920 [Methanomassiliicoccaceae archaeon]|nr:hypothetical protein [Methanomassiliicoccaceae archaeon]